MVGFEWIFSWLAPSLYALKSGRLGSPRRRGLLSGGFRDRLRLRFYKPVTDMAVCQKILWFRRVILELLA